MERVGGAGFAAFRQAENVKTGERSIVWHSMRAASLLAGADKPDRSDPAGQGFPPPAHIMKILR